MPTTLRNTDILFNDGTTQSTAGGAVNTTSILNATAGASLGAVGTYAFMYYMPSPGPNPVTAGNTVAGSNLRYTGVSQSISSPIPAGTWRVFTGIFGFQDPYGYIFNRTALALRIS